MASWRLAESCGVGVCMDRCCFRIVVDSWALLLVLGFWVVLCILLVVLGGSGRGYGVCRDS